MQHLLSSRYVTCNTEITICDLCISSDTSGKLQVCFLAHMIHNMRIQCAIWHTYTTVSMPSDIPTISTSFSITRTQAFNFGFIYKILSFCVSISTAGSNDYHLFWHSIGSVKLMAAMKALFLIHLFGNCNCSTMVRLLTNN